MHKIQNSPHNMEEQTGGWTLPGFNTYCKNYNNHHSVLLVRKHTDLWNRIERPGVDSRKRSELIFDTGAKAIQCRKNNLLNQWCWNNWTSTLKKKSRYTLHKN